MTSIAASPLEYRLIGLTEDGDAGDLLSGLGQKQGRVRLHALIIRSPLCQLTEFGKLFLSA